MAVWRMLSSAFGAIYCVVGLARLLYLRGGPELLAGSTYFFCFGGNSSSASLAAAHGRLWGHGISDAVFRHLELFPQRGRHEVPLNP